MTKRITITQSSQLQFGGFLQNQVIITHNGVEVSNSYYNYNANYLSSCVDNFNPNVAVIHFDELTVTISNGEFNEFLFGGIILQSPLELAQMVVIDASQYTQ